jgi:hypothetical protein
MLWFKSFFGGVCHRGLLFWGWADYSPRRSDWTRCSMRLKACSRISSLS